MSAPNTPTQAGLELAEHAAHCPACSATTASDQRYCLNCGRRLSEPRVDFTSALGLGAREPAAASPRGGLEQRGPLITLAALAAVLLALGVGIVIGRGDGGSSASQKPTVVSVAGGGAPSPTAATPTAVGVATISEDWPSGSAAWTVELSSLPKSGTQASDVQAAKTAATQRGATAVGVLDGDRHGGTPKGKYVIYSGHYSSQKQAEAAQAKLKKKFPGALVLHVTPPAAGGSSGSANNKPSAALTQLHNLSGNAYEQASKKLPAQVGTGGAPPPKDKKAPGNGGSGTCIGC